MIRWSRPRLLLFSYTLLLAAGALLSIAFLLGTPSEGSSSLLAGYSGQRLLLAAVLLVPAASFAWFAYRLARDPAPGERLWASLFGSRAAALRSVRRAAAIFLAGWTLYFIAEYSALAAWSDYLIRLRPAMAWVMELGALTLALGLLQLAAERPVRLGAERQALFAAAIALAVFLSIWLVIALTGLGIRIREDYWYGAGVPALPLQILLALAAGLLTARLERTIRSRQATQDGRRMLVLDLALCALAWAATAVLWAREPLRPSFFMVGPSLPTRDFYPFSDASLFDIGSQFALIGQGILNREYFDRVLYMAFLAYLHGLAGENFIRVMAVQAAVYAVLPLLLYLIGKELSGRSLGASMAVLIALRGLNSIASSDWIDLASPKMVLTDFPAAVLLALFTLLLVRWLKDPFRKWHLALWVGCSLGLVVMLRTNALMLLPLILLFALTVYRTAWRPWIAAGALIALGMFLTTLPWDMRSYSRGGPLFGTYFYRIEVILRDRYGLPIGGLQPEISPPAGAAGISDWPPGKVAAHTPIDEKDCESLVCQGVNHLLHNLETSVLLLPTSPGIFDLRQTVKEQYPYWEKKWLGEGFGVSAGLGLAVNLALIALGIGAAWGTARWVGLVPLCVYLAYVLSNSFALTSGGRYIVPVDWIVCLYYLASIVALARWLAALIAKQGPVNATSAVYAGAPEPESWTRRLGRGLVTAVLILGVGSLIPLSEMPFPLRYVDYSDKRSGFAALESGGMLGESGFKPEALKRFLRNPEAIIVVGRALYPRYYWVGGGESASDYPYLPLDFPRLAFTLIGPTGQKGIILPGDLPARFQNASDVIVLGCRSAKYIDALLVYVSSEPRRIYTRSPASPLTCPLRQPYCLDKVTCR